MAEIQDVKSTGLDRETHLCIVIPGLIWLTGIILSLCFLDSVRLILRQLLSAFQSAHWMGNAAFLILLFIIILGLGYFNHWLSRELRGIRWIWQAVINKAMLNTREVLPTFALNPPPNTENAFYAQLKKQLTQLVGPVEDLKTPFRSGEEIADDLVAAWLLTQKRECCEMGWSQIKMFRERSNFYMALSVAFSVPPCISLSTFLLATYDAGFLSIIGVITTLAISLLIHRWFLMKGFMEWFNGQNLLYRLFWAVWGNRQQN